MPVLVVADHRLKNFDEWIEIFKSNPPPQISRWRLARGIDDPNRVQVVAELEPSEVQQFKAFLESERMQEVFRRVNAMSRAPIEFIWLEQVAP
jgi:hypothetical protein